jgi:hypothetical protein
VILSISDELTVYITDVLRSISKKGVKLWSANGQLRYKAPKGALTQEDIERLKLLRGQIVSLLEQSARAEGNAQTREPRTQFHRAPATFSQLTHWHLYQLRNRPAIRQIASATRLRGRLDVDALRRSAAQIVHRHDALRTQIVVYDGSPTQAIYESGNCELQVEDLASLPEDLRELAILRSIERLILEPIDLAEDPLLGVLLLRLRADENVLIVAMEHMISDAYSMDIFLRELFTAYIQASKACTFSLPAISVQFDDFAIWQKSTHTSWLEKHSGYWTEHLAGCQRLRFPGDKALSTATRSGWGAVTLHIGRDLKKELRDWCRVQHTTLVMGVFTAYVALVLRWCNAPETVILYQTDGRVSPRLENTIGYLASVLYLRISLAQNGTFIDLLNQVIEEYCNAYEHADASYMEAQVPRPGLTRNTLFNWVPQDGRNYFSVLDGTEDAVACSFVPFEHPMRKNLERDTEPFLLLYDIDEEIAGSIWYPLNRFSNDTMDRFGRNFLVFIRALLKDPKERVKDVLLL